MSAQISRLKIVIIGGSAGISVAGSRWLLKRFGLPFRYRNLMLRGRA